MNESLTFRRAVALFFAALLAACDGGGSEAGEATFEVDPELEPVTDVIRFIEGSGSRPVGCIADDLGNHANFVEDEVIVTVDAADEIDAIAARLNGTVLFELDPNETGLLDEPAPIFALLRVDAPEATPEEVEAIAAGRADGAGHLRLCSRRALNTLAAIARESLDEGTSLGANFLLSPDEVSHRETTEASATVLTQPYGRGFSSNAFELPYMDRAEEGDDDWVQDIGAAEARRMIHEVVGDAEGRNRVDLMIIDGGFLADDFPDADIIPAGTFGQVNPPDSCSGGGDCPWHGTNVASAALGRFNDGRGGAGPAGPVASDTGDAEDETSVVNPIFVQTPRVNVWDIIEFVVLRVPEVYARFPDIANISASADVPAGACLLGACHVLDELGSMIRRTGTLVFASAGNDAVDVDARRCGAMGVVCFERAYRIPCEMPGVICVGGLANDRNLRAERWSDGEVSGSAWGSKQHSGDDGSVDIYAPYGMWLQETPTRGAAPVLPSTRARWTQGTSFSSPFAAGVAALIKAASPRLGASEIWEVMRDTAHSKGPGGSIHRWVNAFGAVKRALGGAVPFVNVLEPTEGQDFSLGTGVPLRCEVDDADGMDGVTVSWSSDLDGTIGGASSFTHEPGLQEGVHQVTCTVSDGRFTVSDTVEVSVGNDAPTVEITSPVVGADLYAGNAIWAHARVEDVNGNFEEVYWQLFTSIDLPTGWSGTGPDVTIPAGRLAPGRYTLVATGYDTEGARAQDRVTLNVQPSLADNPPSINNMVVVPVTTHALDTSDWLFTDSCPVDLTGDGLVDHRDDCRRVRVTVYASDDHDPASSLLYEWTVRGPGGESTTVSSGPTFIGYYPVGQTEVSVVVIDSRRTDEGRSDSVSATIRVSSFI